MGVRIIDGGGLACLYCATSGQAFGPVFSDAVEAQEFLDWLAPSAKVKDPRDVSLDALLSLYADFRDHGADSDVRVYAAGVK